MKLEPVNDSRERTESVGARSLSDVLKNGTYGKVLRAVEQVTVFECKLPRIVVIGAENQGKSSTLERIAMRSVFPRLDEVCTFVPIALKLRNSHSDKSFLATRRLSEDGEVLQETIFDSNEADCIVEYKVSEMQTTALKGERASNQSLEIEIHAADVPDLTLVDLPGIVAYPSDVNQITTAMTKEFVRDENTLVICVASATMDSLRSSQAFQVLDNDETETAWKRTLCVITKCDMAHSIPKLTNRINKTANETKMIQSRFVGVINRNSSEADASLPTARHNERKWFQKLVPDLFDSGRVGIDSVLLELDRMISEHVLSTWIPRQLELIDSRKNEIQEELRVLGAPPNQQTLEDMKVALNKGIVALVKQPNFTTEFLEQLFQTEIQVEKPDESQVCIQNPQRQRMQFFQKQKSFWNDSNQYERVMSTIFSQIVAHVLGLFDTDDLPIRFVRFVNLKNECTKTLMDCFQSRIETFVKCMKDVLHDFHMHETRQPISSSIHFNFEQIKTQYRHSMINTCVETCVFEGVESFIHWMNKEMTQHVHEHQLLVESCEAERKTLTEMILKCGQAKSVIRRELLDYKNVFELSSELVAKLNTETLPSAETNMEYMKALKAKVDSCEDEELLVEMVSNMGVVDELLTTISQYQDNSSFVIECAWVILRLCRLEQNRITVMELGEAESLTTAIAKIANEPEMHASQRTLELAEALLVSIIMFPHKSKLHTQCAGALGNLAVITENKVELMELGVVEALLKSMKIFPDRSELYTECAGAFWSLSAETENRVKLMALGVAEALLKSMKSFPDKHQLHTQCAGALGNLTVSTENQVKLMELGVAETLLKSMESFPDRPELYTECAGAFWGMASNNLNQVRLMELGVGDALLKSMKRFPDKSALHTNCAGTFWNLAVNIENQVKLMKLGVAKALLKSMKLFPDKSELHRKCAAAFWNLALNTENQVKLMELGVAKALLKSMKTFPNKPELRTKCAGAFWSLAANTENQLKLMELGVVDVLLKSMKSFPDKSELHSKCAGAFWNLAANAENKVKLMELGVVEALLKSMKSFPDKHEFQRQCAGTFRNLAVNAQHRLRLEGLGVPKHLLG